MHTNGNTKNTQCMAVFHSWVVRTLKSSLTNIYLMNINNKELCSYNDGKKPNRSYYFNMIAGTIILHTNGNTILHYYLMLPAEKMYESTNSKLGFGGTRDAGL